MLPRMQLADRGVWVLGLLPLIACRSNDSRPQTQTASSSSTSASTTAPVASAEPAASPSAAPSPSSPPAAPKPQEPAAEIWPPRLAALGPVRAHDNGEPLEGKPSALVCQGRKPCRILEVLEAGRDADGRTLEVLRVSLAERSRAPDDPARITDGCEPIEYWLVTRAARKTQSVERLLELCNDGYGAAGLGADGIELQPNRFRHDQSGGSAWRYSEHSTLQLSPRRYLELGSSGLWSAGPNRWSRQWSWETFSGSIEYFTPECEPNGEPPESTGGDPWSWQLIPVVDVDPSFGAGAWKEAHLGACAASVGTAAEAGFVVHGEHGGATDSTMKVVGLPDGSFVLEITDDHLVLSAKRRIHEDHVEVWAGNAERPSYTDHCYPPVPERPVQWGVRLADGAVFQGFGAPAPERLQVELGSKQGSVRLRIRPVQDAPLLTFVYSDSDDGQTQKTLIATSRVQHGEILSLGTAQRIDPQAAVCELRAGALEPVLR